MTRFRTGHSNLNNILCIIGKHPTGLCGLCWVPESVDQYQLQEICSRYKEHDVRRDQRSGDSSGEQDWWENLIL